MDSSKQPDPGDRAADLAYTAAAAVEVARAAQDRARRAEHDLAAATARIQALSATGAEQELADAREADRLGVSRFMKDSTAIGATTAGASWPRSCANRAGTGSIPRWSLR